MSDVMPRMDNGRAIGFLRIFRLALSGAIVGAAFIGIVIPGVDRVHGIPADAIGAGAGFMTVLVIKFAHLT